jgi:hypothetical protein
MEQENSATERDLRAEDEATERKRRREEFVTRFDADHAELLRRLSE